MHASLIEHLVQVRGIETEYLDAWGKPALVNTVTQQKILAAMGYPMDDDDALITMINSEAETDWLTMVEPVSLIVQKKEAVLHFKLPLEFVNDELYLSITQNSQICKKIKFVPIDQELLGAFEIGDMEMQHYALPIELDLAIGYYQLALFEPGIEEPLGSGRLIVTPETCYQVATPDSKEAVNITPVKANNTLTLGDNVPAFDLVGKKVESESEKETIFCSNVTLGDAPNKIEPLGRCWNVAPINPTLLYKDAYQPMIELFSSYMKDNETLQVNNIMSLLKSWWVPKGEEANKGAYVYYPFEDLLTIIALESQLSQCRVVIGEFAELPENVTELLQSMGMYTASGIVS
jgi:hypothetical protein